MTDKDIEITIKTKITVDNIEYCSPMCQFFDYYTHESYGEVEYCMFQFNNDNIVDIKDTIIHDRRRTEQCMNRTKASNHYLKLRVKRNKRMHDINFITNEILSEEEVKMVVSDVAEEYGMTVEQIKSKSRKSKFSVPRKCAIYILHEYGVPLAQAAHAVGLVDHSTAYTHYKYMKELVTYPEIYLFILRDNEKQAVQFIKDYKVKAL